MIREGRKGGVKDQSPLGRTVQLRSVLDRLLNDNDKIEDMRRSILSGKLRFVCMFFRRAGVWQGAARAAV